MEISQKLKKYYGRIYRRYDLMNSLFTFGQDKQWREITANEIALSSPKKVIDICCGTGKLTESIAQKLPTTSEVTGYDFSEEMLQVAMKQVEAVPIEKLEFIEGSVKEMPFDDNTFDVASISFGFRNLTFNNPDETAHINEIYRIIKPKGWLVILESSSPPNALVRFFYTIYLFLFMVPMGFLITGNAKAYFYLAKSSRYFYSTRQVIELLNKKGFKVINLRKFLLGSTNLFVFEKQ